MNSLSECVMDEKVRKRFAEKWHLDVGGKETNGSVCWLWDACRSGGEEGYGWFWLNGKMQSAHRVSYIFVYGEIPDELQIDHICHRPRCCSPFHLQAVTASENSMYRFTRDFTYKKPDLSHITHCPSGHAYSGRNLGINKNGHRVCRRCSSQKAKEWRERNPEKRKAIWDKWYAENRPKKLKEEKRHRNRVKTHCPKGHPYSGENLVIKLNGDRACKICREEYMREYRKNNRARVKETTREYYEANSDLIKKAAKQNRMKKRSENPELYRQKKRDYHGRNADSINAKRRELYAIKKGHLSS